MKYFGKRLTYEKYEEYLSANKTEDRKNWLLK